MDEKALSTLTPEQAQVIPAIVQHMMGPLVEAMGKLLENNTAALQQLSAAQQVQNDRLEALERQIRLNTPVTRQQVRYLSAAMKEHALELLDKSSVSDPKAVRKLVGIIKKAGYLALVAVGMVADYLISSALLKIGIDMQINYCFGMIITIWLIINELISILENLGELDVPLPGFLVNIIKTLKNKVEDTADGKYHKKDSEADTDGEHYKEE